MHHRRSPTHRKNLKLVERLHTERKVCIVLRMVMIGFDRLWARVASVTTLMPGIQGGHSVEFRSAAPLIGSSMPADEGRKRTVREVAQPAGADCFASVPTADPSSGERSKSRVARVEVGTAGQIVHETGDPGCGLTAPGVRKHRKGAGHLPWAHRRALPPYISDHFQTLADDMEVVGIAWRLPATGISELGANWPLSKPVRSEAS